MDQRPIIVWFRSDLRLNDNYALRAAAANAPVIPVFIWAPEEEEPWPPGAASRWWLHQSLRNLELTLVEAGSRLTIRKGPTRQVLENLLAETHASGLFWNRRYEPAVRTRDERLKSTFKKEGLEVRSFEGALLFEPWTVLNTGGRPFQTFSTFWKTCLKQANRPEPVPQPDQLSKPSRWPDSMPLESLELEPKIGWAAGIHKTWAPGEYGARRKFQKFLAGNFERYASERDVPNEPGTSGLSPHLHFGEISPREIWYELSARRNQENAQSVDSYLKEIGWREFAYHLLFHFPFTANEPLRREFLRFSWRTDPDLLAKWQHGRTGYPFVDAGMRELWRTGWMHNRVRMVVASFLTKHLRVRWEEGAYWFWDTLVDADLANNTLGWQWTAGCGADAAPYFRIFNPVLQGERFDPEGEYIRRWIPELRRLAAPWIHKPWMAPAPILAEADVQLGSNYPVPVVAHDKARREALEAFELMRKM